MSTIGIEENSSEAKVNVITFYYKEKEATINYVAVGPAGAMNFGSVSPTTETVKVLSGSVNGSTPTAGDGYRFAGWFKDEACTEKVTENWVDANNKITPQKTDGQYAAVTYYAKFEPALIELTIRKTVDVVYSDNPKFVFQIRGTDTNTNKIDMKVAVAAEESVTIKDLPAGKYTVTEVSSGWRYTADTSSISGEYMTDSTLTFRNTSKNNKWLSWGKVVENFFYKFSGGGQ